MRPNIECLRCEQIDKWYVNRLRDLKVRLVEAGLHQRKPISVITFNNILNDVFVYDKNFKLVSNLRK